MKEHEFRCQKCGNVWYVTKKDIRESRKLKYNIRNAKVQNFSLYHGKKYVQRNTQIAQMQLAYRDPYQCQNCGSRCIDELIDEPNTNTYDETTWTQHKVAESDVSVGARLLIILAILFMPYLGIYLVLRKKPFSPRADRNCIIYCVFMCCMAAMLAMAL